MDIKGIGIGSKFPVRVMGIINLSPESFYGESIVTDKEGLRNRVRTMEDQGADIIDIGGASTAPPKVYGTKPISVDEELSRVKAALEAIAGTTKLPISIDTTSSTVAEAALDLGASLVNDVSGLKADERMGRLVAEREVPIVLMASCSEGCQTVELSLEALRRSMQLASKAEIPEEHIILDPGIGFGKPPEIDFEILRNLHRYSELGRPMLVGVSRKAFIGSLLDAPNPNNRLHGTIAATSIAVANGADIIRAHDIPEAVTACRVGESVRKRRDG